MKKEYTDKVELLVETLPFIAKETCFALKGGTAINLFYRDMPRLSVDIDLTYTGFDERRTAYKAINDALGYIATNLTQNGYTATVQGTGEEKKIIVSNQTATIKIEPNYTIRGCAYAPTVHAICEKAEREYGYAEIQIVSLAELFGGKICAALDRQHPRDLFDIQGILHTPEQTPNLIHGFLVMLLSHNRPIHELLNPVPKDQSEVFEKEFKGMTDTFFSYQDHTRVFRELVDFIQKETRPYAHIIHDFLSLNLDYESTEIPNLDRLPAIQWKLQNLRKLKKENPKKFTEQNERLLQLFS